MKWCKARICMPSFTTAIIFFQLRARRHGQERWSDPDDCLRSKKLRIGVFGSQAGSWGFNLYLQFMFQAHNEEPLVEVLGVIQR
jgi:hypothetical protein